MAALESAKTAVALLDRSNWGCISVMDADRVRFLHNQTTNDLQALKPGQGCSTVFVTSTARTIDLVSAYIRDEDVLLLTSPGLAPTLMEWMDRYIFFADKVTPKDRTAETFVFSIVGPDAQESLSACITGDLPQAPFAHRQLTVAGATVTVAADSGLALPGLTLMGDRANAEAVQSALGKIPVLPPDAWEQLRIEQGRPLPGQSLTDDDNPLEAGLWSAVSFNKGCYIGQETIARLNTYKGVKKRLWGLTLSQPVAPGTVLTLDGDKVGDVRSVAALADGSAIGLGYVRTKAGGDGLALQAGKVAVTVQAVPGLSHDYYDSSA
ncbi:MAG: folate-binding protein [Cyanobacteria bacterium J06632_22]